MVLTSFALTLTLALAAPAPPVVLDRAEALLMDHWDAQGSLQGLSMPTVRKADRPALQWLANALGKGPLVNPFPHGDRRWAEAAALVQAQKTGHLPQTPTLSLTGSSFALWRVGRELHRQHPLPKAARVAWEDLLVQPACPPLVREGGLRHALSMALADRDEARIQALKAAYGGEAPKAFQPFLAGFGLLDAPFPTMRTWNLPDLNAGPLLPLPPSVRRIWICPAPEGTLPTIPENTLWLVPTREGGTPAQDDLLDEASRKEGEALATRLGSLAPRTRLAPSRATLETTGLILFPCLVELTPEGRVQRILMAEAALAEGHYPSHGPR